MKMKFSEFHSTLLDAVLKAKKRQPTASIHLLYAPELADPLELVGDVLRNIALINSPVKVGWTAATAPRLLTLNGSGIGVELLNAEGGIGDAMLQRSIQKSYANIFGDEQVQVALTNDDPGMAENAICGWVVSPEPARQIAARIARLSNLWGAKPSSQIARWFYPHCFVGLWPELEDHQKHALLSGGTWLLHDHFGQLQQYGPVQESSDETSWVPKFSSTQRRIIDNTLVVSALAKCWQSISRIEQQPIPKDAVSKLHQFVLQGQRHHLDAEDLMIYVMTAVQLPNGALEDQDFSSMLAAIAEDGVSLRDGLSTLPDNFWQRYQPATPIPA